MLDGNTEKTVITYKRVISKMELLPSGLVAVTVHGIPTEEALEWKLGIEADVVPSFTRPIRGKFN